MLFLSQCTAAPGQSGVALSRATALYARVVRLSHNQDAKKNGQIIASVTAFPNRTDEPDIYSRVDGDLRFVKARSPAFYHEHCQVRNRGDNL